MLSWNANSLSTYNIAGPGVPRALVMTCEVCEKKTHHRDMDHDILVWLMGILIS